MITYPIHQHLRPAQTRDRKHRDLDRTVKKKTTIQTFIHVLFNVFITSRNVFIFNIKRSLALFSMSFCVQIRLLLPIILGISPPVLFVGSCLAYNTCMTKYAHTCKYLFDLLGYSITLIGAPFVLCKSEVSCTNSHCTVFYVFIRNISCNTLCFCFIILPEADPNFFSVMYIKTNHIIGRLPFLFPFSTLFVPISLTFLFFPIIYLMNI